MGKSCWKITISNKTCYWICRFSFNRVQPAVHYIINYITNSAHNIKLKKWKWHLIWESFQKSLKPWTFAEVSIHIGHTLDQGHWTWELRSTLPKFLPWKAHNVQTVSFKVNVLPDTDVGVSRGYTDHCQGWGHPWGRQPHSLIFMSTLYNAL